jgi:hypothetical protein
MPELIHIRGEGGAIFQMALPLPKPIQQRLDKGYLSRVNPDGTPYRGPRPAGPDGPDGPAAGGTALTRGETPRPPKTALKPQWVGWAVAVHGLDPEIADGMTKGDLMDLPATPPAPAAPPQGERPADDAPKAEWVEYTVRRGQLSREDAEVYTRDDLIDLMS